MPTQQKLIPLEERALTLLVAVVFAVGGIFLMVLAFSLEPPVEATLIMGAPLFPIFVAGIPCFLAFCFVLPLAIDWWAGRPERREHRGRTCLTRELDAYVAEGSVPAKVVNTFADSALPTVRKRDIAAWLAEGTLTVDDALELLTIPRSVARSLDQRGRENSWSVAAGCARLNKNIRAKLSET